MSLIKLKRKKDDNIFQRNLKIKTRRTTLCERLCRSFMEKFEKESEKDDDNALKVFRRHAVSSMGLSTLETLFKLDKKGLCKIKLIYIVLKKYLLCKK